MSTNAELIDGYYVWNKGESLWLSNWFRTKEFSCKCSNSDCIKNKISKELIDRLNTIREETASPIRVHSAYRCEKYQTHLRESGVNTVVAQKSQHELGNAADISSSRLTSSELYNVCKRYFDSLGKANNFTHVDLRPAKPGGVKREWLY